MMSSSQLLDTRTTNFGDLIRNGKIYRVPAFQRDYSWTIENWEDLWQDIESIYQDGDRSHYMGAIVLQNSLDSDKEFTIIDGQQRLATLSILAIAILDKLQTLIDQGQAVEENRERQDILRRTYLSDKDPRSLRYSSKLLLNANNNDFYQSNLINLRQPKNQRRLTKSNQLLWQAFDYFSKCLDGLTHVIKSGEELTTFLTDVVAQRLLFIQINVQDELNAYTVFETLNARGIELSATDLLKNYLFSLFQGPDDLREAQRQWGRLVSTVTMRKFPDFLRYYLSLFQTRVRKDRLFKMIRQLVKNNQQAFDLLNDLENYSDIFVALGDSHDELWRDRPDCQPYIRELQLFRVKQAYPTLFAAYIKFSPSDFLRLLRLIGILSFRYLVVSQLNPNELEKIYNDVAIAIMNEQITTPRDVFNSCRSIYVPDHKFQQDFSFLTISTKGRKKLAQYILAKLEEHECGHPIERNSFSIEHILPESASESWRRTFTDTQLDEMTDRLGNLTLLEPNFNRELGNHPYAVKQQTYQKSRYRLTQSISAQEWAADSLVDRQNHLARQAVQIWQADFV